MPLHLSQVKNLGQISPEVSNPLAQRQGGYWWLPWLPMGKHHQKRPRLKGGNRNGKTDGFFSGRESPFISEKGSVNEKMENKKRSSLLHLHDFQISTVSPWRFGVFWILTKSRSIHLRNVYTYIYIFIHIYIYKYMAKMCQRGMFHQPLTAFPTGKKTNYYKLLQTVVCFRMRCGIMFSLCLWYDLLGKKQHKKDPFDERAPVWMPGARHH